MSNTKPGHLRTADRLRKLRAMSAGELWSRVRYDAYCRIERSRHARGALSAPGRLRDGLIPDISCAADWKTVLIATRRQSTGRFFPGVEHRQKTVALMREEFQAECRRAEVEADRALRREFSFFGKTFRYAERVDWHADPVTKRPWPRVYHRDVPVDGGNVGFGDVKHVWELSRHQFIMDLAKAWALDPVPAYSTAARTLVADWRAENPVGTGVAWACALEPAFRVLSWLWGYFLVIDDPEFDQDSHIGWLEGFYDHGWFLYRHLEYYKSPYNHLIGEACALYCLGVLFPEFRESSKWRTHGRHVLESRLSSQFYGDGGSVEQSTFYHHATTGFYLLAILLGRANGEEFSHEVLSAVERALEFSMLMQQPDGTTPRIGGADDGKPIRMEHLPLWDFRPYQAIGAVLFGRRDFKGAAGRFFEDALWLLGPEGASAFDAIVPELPQASEAMPASGYVVLRDRWAVEANYLCFDCGEQAAGLRRDDIPSAAHGHADCLSVILWRGGRPVLVDAGFHCYNGPKAWQDHFRETAAHNTVRIDGRDQAQHINKMAWAYTYTARLEHYELSGPSCWAAAAHDGYRRLERGSVLHRRAAWTREKGYVVLCDFFEGAGSHEVEVTFQFAPGALQLDDAHALFDRRAALHWFASVELEPRVFEGGSDPDGGWIAPTLGVKAAAPRLVLAGTMTLPTTIITIISDRFEDDRRISVGAASRPGTIRVAGLGWEDWLIVKGYGDAPGRDLETDGLAAAWRHADGRLFADGSLDGTYQRA